MKTFNYRFVALLVATLMTTAISAARTPDVDGTVIDEKGDPMPFVNVVLLTLPDSAFVQGAMTDDQGHFHIPAPSNDGVLKVSSIGYETLYLNPATTMGRPIQMKEATLMLGEIVVKSQLPKTRVKGEAMRTTVEGTILEKAGTVADALSKVPSLEAQRDGAVKVLGRGEAEVYINGRKVQDVSELSRLRSEQIQHIDVIQNPGARYAASTKAVVRIQLKKAQGDGFGFQENASAMYQYGTTITNNLDVNYRTGGLDITASLWAGRYGHVKTLQENDLLYYVGGDTFHEVMNQDGRNIWKGWSPQLQINYMVNENHSMGAFYKYDYHPGADYRNTFMTDNYRNDDFTEHSESNITQNDRFHKHIFNSYYNGKVGNLGIDLNIDGLFDRTNVPGRTTEVTTLLEEGETITRSIDSNTGSANNFWAAKLILSYPVWKGNLSLGGEYSHNHRTDAYDFSASNSVPVKATDTEINESSTAAFVEFGRAFGRVFAQVGLRYEHMKNDYYNFNEREDEVCRDYGDWFPTAVITAPVGKVQLSLSYRRDIQRPHYSSLTSSTVYINRYTYQSGNPYLKPTYTHSLVLNAAYRWMNLMVNFANVQDSQTMSTEPFPGAEDPMVSLVRPINSKESYNRLIVMPSVQPVIGCWHPTWSIYSIFQDYKAFRADGSTITLNHPFVSLTWDNVLVLKDDLRLNLTAQWLSRGDYDNFRVTRTRFYSAIGVQKDLNLHSLGSLTVDLRCMDLFNTNKTGATIYGMRELTTFNPARRTFMLDLTWRFNKASSKYRGTGAGDKQKARM